MTTICITFQIHQPQFLKPYRFFELGSDHSYFDEFSQQNQIKEGAAAGYFKTNQLLLELITWYPDTVKCNFCITGATLDLFSNYYPELLTSFKQLAETGNVEFLGGTYTHAATSLCSKSAFQQQVDKNARIHKKLLNVTPTTFCNSGLIYSDNIGEWVSELGYQKIITEAEPSVLGWNSPNQSFTHPSQSSLKIVLRNAAASDNLTYRLSDEVWQHQSPLEIDLVNWIEKQRPEDSTQILLPYELLSGSFQKEKSNFISDLMQLISGMSITIARHDEEIKNTKERIVLKVPETITCLGELKAAEALFDSPLTQDALKQLTELTEKANQISDETIAQDLEHLQALEHFIWMLPENTGMQQSFPYKNPYENEYKAYINYMNVLSDLMLRVDFLLPQSPSTSATHLLNEKKIRQKDEEIMRYKTKLKNIQKLIKSLESEMED